MDSNGIVQSLIPLSEEKPKGATVANGTYGVGVFLSREGQEINRSRGDYPCGLCETNNCC